MSSTLDCFFLILFILINATHSQPGISIQPKLVKEGQNVSITCTFKTVDEEIKFSIQFEDKVIVPEKSPDGEDGKLFYITHELGNVTEVKKGNYTCSTYYAKETMKNSSQLVVLPAHPPVIVVFTGSSIDCLKDLPEDVKGLLEPVEVPYPEGHKNYEVTCPMQLKDGSANISYVRPFIVLSTRRASDEYKVMVHGSAICSLNLSLTWWYNDTDLAPNTTVTDKELQSRVTVKDVDDAIDVNVKLYSWDHLVWEGPVKNSPTPSQSTDNSGLAGESIAAIVVCVIAVLIGFPVLVYLWYNSKLCFKNCGRNQDTAQREPDSRVQENEALNALNDDGGNGAAGATGNSDANQTCFSRCRLWLTSCCQSSNSGTTGNSDANQTCFSRCRLWLTSCCQCSNCGSTGTGDGELNDTMAGLTSKAKEDDQQNQTVV